MTDIARTITDGCALAATTVYELLCVDTPNRPPYYDGAYTITVGTVRAHFTPHGVQLTFPDPILPPQDAPVTVTVAGDHTYGAMHTLITALSVVVNP